MNLSQIYVSAVVLVLNHVLPMLGIDWDSGHVGQVAHDVVDLALAVWILIRRYQAGDITTLGQRK